MEEALHAAPGLEEALCGLPERVAVQAHLGAREHVIHLGGVVRDDAQEVVLLGDHSPVGLGNGRHGSSLR